MNRTQKERRSSTGCTVQQDSNEFKMREKIPINNSPEQKSTENSVFCCKCKKTWRLDLLSPTISILKLKYFVTIYLGIGC